MQGILIGRAERVFEGRKIERLAPRRSVNRLRDKRMTRLTQSACWIRARA